MTKKNKSQERGNVMFYILIAVALLAALIYAVNQSGRGSVSKVNEEKARLLASEIVEYANAVATATSQLRLRGVDVEDLCFDAPEWGNTDYDHAGCTDNGNKIFHLDGGGVTWKTAPAQAMDSSASPDNRWLITGANEIYQVGSTGGTASSADLVLAVNELNKTTCDEINKLLKVTRPSEDTPNDAEMDITPFAGTFAANDVVADESTIKIEGKTAACFHETASPGQYVFYKVLQSR